LTGLVTTNVGGRPNAHETEEAFLTKGIVGLCRRQLLVELVLGTISAGDQLRNHTKQHDGHTRAGDPTRQIKWRLNLDDVGFEAVLAIQEAE